MADLGTLVVRLALMGASEFREDMKRASSAVESFQSSAADFAEQARASFGGQVLETMVRFGAEAVTAFLEAEKASQRLEHAVGRTAGHMPGFASGLSEVADAMERATDVDGDYIKGLQQLALQFQVAPALVNRATQAALDWAEATGGSAKQGLQLLTTANADNLTQLAKWGVKVSEADLQIRGLTAVLEQMEKVYGGTASQVHEGSKALATHRAAWGDLKEAIGQTAAELIHLSGVTKASAGAMDILTEFITSKKSTEVDEYRKKVEAETAAIDRLFNLSEKIKEDEAQMFRLGPQSPMFDEVADSLNESRKLLGQFERELRVLKGQATVAPVLTFDDEDALQVETSLWKQRTEAAKEATAAYERFAHAADRASKQAANEDGRFWRDVAERADADDKATMQAYEADLQAENLIEKMNREMAEADAALSRAAFAGDAESAAAAFAKLYQDAQDFARSAKDAADRAKDALVNRALGSLGNLGGIIQRAMDAVAGGPIAVVASIVMDVLMQSETFQRIVATLNGILKVVADALGQLLAPLLPLVGAVGMVITALMPLVAMLADLVTTAVEPLTPIIVLVATVLQALMPVVTVLAQAFLMITNPLMMIAGPVLHALFDVLKAVGLIVLNVAKAIGDAWNWIIGGIQSVFRALADISILGAKPLGFLDDWADSLDSAKVDTEAMAHAIAELTGLSYELALAKAKEAQASFENAQATKRLTDLNTPERWKRLLRTGEAADPQAPPPPPGSRPPGSAPPAAPAPGAPPAGGGVLPPFLSNGPIGDIFDIANGIARPAPSTGGGMGTIGSVVNIVNNLTVNGSDSGEVLAEAEQRGYLTNQRAADSSSGTPVRAGPFQLSLG